MPDSLPMNDHDALITLMTEMRGLRADVKELKENSVARIDKLEREKVAVAEAARLADELRSSHSDHEERIRKLEADNQNFKGKYALLAAVALVALSAFFGWLFKKI